LFERFTDPSIDVEGLVGNEDIGFDPGKQCVSAIQVMRLTWRKIEARWIALCVCRGVNFGAQSSA
jgi:hypothetical protein